MPGEQGERVFPFLVLCCAAVALSAAIRLACSTGDLWLDEIWTLDLIGKGGPPSQVLSIHHNNNHPLNTWFLYAIGDQGDSFWRYRVHSLVAGVGTVIMAGLLALRLGRLECLLAVLLVGSSYVLIHFSTEARGYSLMVFFALAAFYALERFVALRSWPSAAAFWVCCILGLLSHLFFVQFYAAAGLWSVVAIALRSPRRVALRDTARAHAPVFVFVVFLLLTFMSSELQGGAVPTGSIAQSVMQAVALALGGPSEPGLTAQIVCGLALAGFLLGLWTLRRDPNAEWIFYALACFLVPAVLLALDRPYAVFLRYFLVSITFFLVLLAFALAILARAGKEGRIIVALAVGLFAFGNAVNTTVLLRHGHGQYLAALEYMAEHSKGEAVTIGSDHPFRNGLLVEFYRRFLPDEAIRYIAAGHGPPEWLIVHYPGSRSGRGDEAVLYEEREYRLERIFRTSDLAGFDWRVYRRGSKYRGVSENTAG